MMFDRVVILVLDGVGIGALPDASAYADQDAATLQHVAAAVGGLNLPNLELLGLGRIEPIKGLDPDGESPACWGKMAERSAGKDSVTGHWELAGVVQEEAFATFPHGFPEAIIAAFEAATGLKPLGNIPASGTAILRQLGEEHLRSGQPIVYTSLDSVFQIAAHEEIIPLEKLYRICRQTEEILKPWNICRVIARPFRGETPATFYRTAGRRDFTLSPSQPTLLKRMQQRGLDVCGVGKISDLYAGDGITCKLESKENAEGMAQTLTALHKINKGLIMTNLVDFDMLYGHRQDAAGFAAALEEFDAWLPQLRERLSERDLLIVTADHGCDPTTAGTDHSREFVPLLAYHRRLISKVDLGCRRSFADVGATVADNFGLQLHHGCSFLAEMKT